MNHKGVDGSHFWGGVSKHEEHSLGATKFIHTILGEHWKFDRIYFQQSLSKQKDCATMDAWCEIEVVIFVIYLPLLYYKFATINELVGYFSLEGICSIVKLSKRYYTFTLFHKHHLNFFHVNLFT